MINNFRLRVLPTGTGFRESDRKGPKRFGTLGKFNFSAYVYGRLNKPARTVLTESSVSRCRANVHTVSFVEAVRNTDDSVGANGNTPKTTRFNQRVFDDFV